jgi:DNA-binding NarL/FixJ family response regulator
VNNRGRPATVLVASGNPIYRHHLATAIGSHPDLRSVGEAGDGEEAVRLIAEKHPDVALIEVPMAGLDGIAISESVTARLPEWRTRVVLLSSHLDPAVVSSAMSAGAAGFMTKGMSHEEIGEAVARVARGGTAFMAAAAA